MHTDAKLLRFANFLWGKQSRYDGWRMSFEFKKVIRFKEVDAAGIVFFSRFFEFAHDAFEALLQDMKMGLAYMLHETDWIMPLVHVEADYHAPLRLGEEILIQVRVQHCGSRSITFAFEFIGVSDECRRAVVIHRHAFVDKGIAHSRAMPAEFRAALIERGLLKAAPLKGGSNG